MTYFIRRVGFILGAAVLWAAGISGIRFFFIDHAAGICRDVGYSNGFVYAHLHGEDERDFSFSFEGGSRSQWHWKSLGNYAYEHLAISWQNENDKDQKAFLALPSMAYQAGDETGTLTPEVIARWISSRTNKEFAENKKHQAQAIYQILKDASVGQLPAPRHHPIHPPSPLGGHIMHGELGLGLGYTHLVLLLTWIVVWGVLVVVLWRKWFKKDVDK